MTEDQALEKLRGLIRWGYGQKEMAEDAGVSQAYICAVLNGKKRPSDKVLSLVGVKKVIEVKIVRNVNHKYFRE